MKVRLDHEFRRALIWDAAVFRSGEMTTFLDLFSPATHEAFTQSARDVTGFRVRHHQAAERVSRGGRLLCSLTKLSRWVGVLEIVDGPYEDETPLFMPETDPFVVRFKVRPLVWLPPERGVPIKHPSVWSKLSFTRDHEQGSTTWTGKVRTSLCPIDDDDTELLEKMLQRQANRPRAYPSLSFVPDLAGHGSRLSVRLSEGSNLVRMR